MLMAVTTTMVVAVLTNIHWLARPHIFSWPLTLALVAMLESERLPRWRWWALMFVFWVNLHGAFVFGWLLIGMYLAGHVVEAFASQVESLASAPSAAHEVRDDDDTLDCFSTHPYTPVRVRALKVDPNHPAAVGGRK